MKMMVLFAAAACCMLVFGVKTKALAGGKKVSVHHEWGKLKEVVVGRGEGLRMPGYSKLVDFIYDPKYLEKMKKTGGRPAAELEPEMTEKVIEQIDNLAEVLEQHGVVVHRPKLLDAEQSKFMEYVQKGQMQLYARDPMLVIGNTIIETSLKVPMRAKERFGLRDILSERAVSGDANFVAMPAPDPNFPENGIYIEGGDVMLNGYDIYVGNSGRASSDAGRAWLQAVLGPEYRVQEVKLADKWEHLDCVLALLRPGLALLHREGVIGELPESLKGWDFIAVTEEEAKHLGANCMVLDDTTVIMDSTHKRIIEEVRKRGHKVIEIPYDAVSTWGGAMRCSHHPLIRESKLD